MADYAMTLWHLVRALHLVMTDILFVTLLIDFEAFLCDGRELELGGREGEPL